MTGDFFLNGQASGDVATTLMECGMDPGALRPYRDRKGRTYVTLADGLDANGEPKYKDVLVANAQATLRKDDWIRLDESIIKVARERLRAVADLRGSGLEFSMPNGMAHTVLQHERMSDISDARTGMDPISPGEGDRPHFELVNLPLPVIWKDFHFTARQLMVSRNSSMPLDTATAEIAGRKVAEQAEKLLLGTASSFSYGGGTLYGYTNFPSRNTKTDVTAPTDAAWVPSTTVADVLDCIQTLKGDNYFGPYMLYHSTDWDEYLDNDYYHENTSGSVAPTKTLRNRLREIDDISDVRRLDFLTDTFTLIFVQMTSDVAQEVVGMDITTVQWDTHGGMQKNFKVMAIMVPRLRADHSGNCGILHATTA